MAETPPPVSIAPARKSMFGRASFVWIIPIMALAISLAVAWQSYASRGPLIEIVFESAAGIKKRETELRYRDVAVGVVEDLKFAEDLSGVIAHVRMDKDVAPFIDVAATFWVVTPELTTRGVSGLDTVLSGVYIEGDWDADIGPPQTRFNALAETPLFRFGQEGLQITLRTTPGGSLTDDSPITFRGIEVGRVGKAQISRAGNFAIADAIIYHPHSDLITPSTRFWDTSGFTFSVGTNGAEIDFSSVATLLAGGVTFDTFVSGGGTVRDGALFEVFADETVARNSLFRQPEIETLEMRVVFDENISGLAVDAPVELSGLRIGQVQSVSGIIDPDTFGDNRVRLNAVLSVQPARLGLQNEVSREAALNFLVTRIAEGLRARLATGGLLSGGLKIELVQVDDAPPTVVRTGDGIIPIIPTTDSEISDVTATVEGVVSRINNLPIEELLASAIDFLDGASSFVADPDLRETPGDVRAVLEELRTVIASEDVRAIPVTLNAALGRIESLLADLEETQVADRLVAAVDAAAGAANGVTASVEGV
ncbi:MAG: intermembrane transport protein PqiB, partial [Tateyamaria sp.]